MYRGIFWLEDRFNGLTVERICTSISDRHLLTGGQIRQTPAKQYVYLTAIFVLKTASSAWLQRRMFTSNSHLRPRGQIRQSDCWADIYIWQTSSDWRTYRFGCVRMANSHPSGSGLQVWQDDERVGDTALIPSWYCSMYMGKFSQVHAD